MFWGLLNVCLNTLLNLIFKKFYSNITQILAFSFLSVFLSDCIIFLHAKTFGKNANISLNILLSYSFRCDFTIISWNLTIPEQTSKQRRTWYDKVQVIKLSNSSSVVSPWVQLSGGSELWMHVCVQSWGTGPGLVSRPHLEKNAEVLRLKRLSRGFQNKSLAGHPLERVLFSSVQKFQPNGALFVCRHELGGWKPAFSH